VALEEPEIGRTDSNILIDINSTDDVGCHGAASIVKMKLMKSTRAIPPLLTANDDGPQLIIRGLTWEPVMSTGMRATIVMMPLQMRKKKHRKPMIDQSRIWRTEGIVSETEGIVLDSVKIGQYNSDL